MGVVMTKGPRAGVGLPCGPRGPAGPHPPANTGPPLDEDLHQGGGGGIGVPHGTCTGHRHTNTKARPGKVWDRPGICIRHGLKSLAWAGAPSRVGILSSTFPWIT